MRMRAVDCDPQCYWSAYMATDLRNATARPAPVSRPQFVARFVNGVHSVFNYRTFSHGPALPTARKAREVAAGLNSGAIRW